MALSEQIVVDTSFLVGLVDSRDTWHISSVALRDALKPTPAQLVYLDCVVNETISVLIRRAQERKRGEELSNLLAHFRDQVPDDLIVWVSAETQRLYAEILKLIQDTAGELNFHDALIALACRDLNIGFIASFDQDFDQIS